MKIGILTYHNALNYGAALQAYALQQHITKKGHECDILDYSCHGVDAQYSYKKFSRLAAFPSDIKTNLNVFLHSKKRKNFEKFQKRLALSDSYNKSNIKEADSKYDLFIVGSDQVWNYTNNNSDDTYFLSFTKDNAKKYSYAASFGISVLPQEQKELYENLKSFNKISVRESAGADIVREVTGREVPVVCDPVFLRTKEEWSRLADDAAREKKGKKYILVYQLYYTQSLLDFADKLAEKTGLALKVVSISLKTEIHNRLHGIGCSNVSPDEFVSLISNAEYVVTNSFHGAALSLIFNQRLFIELVEAKYNVNSRFKELIDLYDLSKVLINKDTDIGYIPDYREINRKIKEFAEKSDRYIDSMLEGETVIGQI